MTALPPGTTSPWPNRAERRREQAKRRERIDAPKEIEDRIRAEIASAIAKRHFEFFRGESVDAVFQREISHVFEFAQRDGFVLSFDVPEMTPQALTRGVIAYSLKRRPLN